MASCWSTHPSMTPMANGCVRASRCSLFPRWAFCSSRGDDPIALAFSSGGKPPYGRFQRRHATLRAKMIDGTFPDIDRLIPTGNDKILTLDTKALAGLLHRVTPTCSPHDAGVRLTLTPDMLAISVNSTLWGSASGSMAAAYDGPRFEIGFNRHYLGDILKVSGGQTRIAFCDLASPVLFTDPADPSITLVLMPMHVV